MDELTLNPAISASMEALGITQDSLEENESLEVDAESTDAEVETEEALEGDVTDVEGEAVTDDGNTEPKAEGDETQEAPAEEPKLTAKEFQEIEAQKTKIAEEQKAFMEERSKFQAEMSELKEKFQEKIKTHDEFDAFFIDLEAKDPDLFGLIKSAFQEHTRQYNNPVVSDLRSQISKISEELNQFKSVATAEVTLSKLDADIKALSDGLGKEAESVGVKMDLGKVKEHWSKNPGLSLEESAFAVYGPALLKAQASKSKVAAAEKKVQARPAVKTAGQVKGSSQPVAQAVPRNTAEAVYHFAKQLTGKAVS